MEEKDKISVEIMPEADGEERNSVSETPKTDVKGTVKDSVFRDLFGNRKYALSGTSSGRYRCDGGGYWRCDHSQYIYRPGI